MNKTKTTSSGFTLIELMIGLLLTSLFVGGMGRVFFSVSDNFKIQKSLSYMMEDARFTLDKLNSEFRRTGYLANKSLTGWDKNAIYHDKLALDYAGGVYTIRNNGDIVPGTVLDMGNEEVIGGFTDLAGLNSDTVIIRYQLEGGAELDNNQYSPCTDGFSFLPGEPNPPNLANPQRHIVVIVFYMEFDAGEGSNVLYCRAFRENLDLVPALNFELLSAVPLISNVEKLRVLYGQTNAAADPTTVYRTVDQVSAWGDVKSVRISIVLRSDTINLSVGVPGNYTINGKLSFAPTNAAERRLYRVFSTTAAFRNELL